MHAPDWEFHCPRQILAQSFKDKLEQYHSQRYHGAATRQRDTIFIPTVTAEHSSTDGHHPQHGCGAELDTETTFSPSSQSRTRQRDTRGIHRRRDESRATIKRQPIRLDGKRHGLLIIGGEHGPSHERWNEQNEDKLAQEYCVHQCRRMHFNPHLRRHETIP